MEIFKIFTLESAHHLPNVPEGHKCRRLHGHSFHVEAHVVGPLMPKEGWVQTSPTSGVRSSRFTTSSITIA